MGKRGLKEREEEEKKRNEGRKKERKEKGKKPFHVTLMCFFFEIQNHDLTCCTSVRSLLLKAFQGTS